MDRTAKPRPKRVSWKPSNGPMPLGVYLVGKPSCFANRYSGRGAPREEAFEQYKRWLYDDAQRGFRNQVRSLLRGRDLACHCDLADEYCHADLLIEVAASKIEL